MPNETKESHKYTIETGAVLAPEVGLLVLIFGVCVWHWLYFLFYESKEGERRKNERRQEKREYRGPPWGDPEI